MNDATKSERRRATSRASYHRRKKPRVLSDHPCECGCGQLTYIAHRTSNERGWIKGQPIRFVVGHGRRRYHEPPPTAQCRLCKITKPAAEFYTDKARPNGFSSACRECAKAQSRARYKANPERSHKQSEQWRKDNPERYRMLANERRQRRRTRIRESVVEKINPEDIYARDGFRCHICEKYVAKKDRSLDHLIPISKGGGHIVLNVRLAHIHCNVKRGAGRIPAQLLLH